MRLELPTLLPAPGGLTLGAGSRCGLEGAERCGVVAALGVARGAAAGSPPARSRGRLSHEHCSGCGTWRFPRWTSWGCSWPLLPTCRGLSSSSAAIPGLGGGTDGSVLSILLWEPHTGATSSLSPGQGVHIHAESCKMPERGAAGAGGPMASSCSAQTLLGRPEAAPGAVPSSPCWQQCAWCLGGLRCRGFAGDCASPWAEPRSARGMLLDHPRSVLGPR